MKKRHYGKYIFRWLMTLLLLAGLVFAGIGGTRLLHIYLTSNLPATASSVSFNSKR